MKKSNGLKKIKTAVFISGRGTNLKSLIREDFVLLSVQIDCELFSFFKRSRMEIILVSSSFPDE